MFDLFSEVSEWIRAGQKFALATVINTWGSSPRSTGAKMAVNQVGEIIGSVSGGCVEGAVVAACMDTIKTGSPRLLHFDVADETAMEVGLACGGELDVFVSIPSPEFLTAFSQAHKDEQALTTITMLEGQFIGRQIILNQDGSTLGGISREFDDQLKAIPASQTMPTSLTSGINLFIDVNSPPPKLIIVGGVHIAVALTKIARASGYRVIIIDPRRQFGTQVRFPEADQILHLWPDRAFEEIQLTPATAIAFLTHDPKIDDPGLVKALPSKVFYVGALGSRKTQQSRRQRLLDAGLTEDQLARIHGPIGLPLGGRSPEEIAVAIMAEIIQTRNE